MVNFQKTKKTKIVKTKPFDLEAAKAGAKVVTRSGESVEIVEILSFDGRGSFPIIGYIQDREYPSYWTREGRFYSSIESVHDLLIVEEEKPIGWIARDKSGGLYFYIEKPKRGRCEWVFVRRGWLRLDNSLSSITWEDEPVPVYVKED